MIVLGDPNAEQAQMFQSGLLNTLNMLVQQQLRDEYLQKQLQNQKDLLEYKTQLEDQRRNSLLNKLFGYDTPTLEMTQPQPIDDNPINTAVQNFLNPRPQQQFNLKTPDIQFKFAQPSTPGLAKKIESNLPGFKIGQKHTEGLLSKQYLKTGIPTIEDHFIAQTYGFELPKVERKIPKVVGHGKVDLNDKIIPYVIMQDPVSGEINFKFDKELYKGLTPKQRREFKEKLKEEKEKLKADKTINPNQKQNQKQKELVSIPFKDFFSVLNKMSTVEIRDPWGKVIDTKKRPIPITRIKNYFGVKELVLTDLEGNKYKVRTIDSEGHPILVINGYELKAIGVDSNLKPIIDLNGVKARIVSFRDGEPVVQYRENGSYITIPISKINKYKRKNMKTVYQYNDSIPISKSLKQKEKSIINNPFVLEFGME